MAEVLDYNPYDPNFYTTRPFEIYKRMRDEQPVYHSKEWGWYALTRFEDINKAINDWKTYLSFEGLDIDNSGEQSAIGNMAYSDNPHHDELRRIVQPFFQPKSIQEMDHPIRRAVRKLIANWKPGDKIDFAQQLAWPLPLVVFFELLGLPTDENNLRDLERISHQLKDRVPGTPELSETCWKANYELRAFLASEIRLRHKEPKDDMLTHIVQSKINGVPFVDENLDEKSEIIGMLFLLFLAGFESTAGLLGTMVKLLGENPEQLDKLLADRSLIVPTIEETMRWATPLQLTARTSSVNVTLHDVLIPAGSRIVLVVGASNRDDRQFENPDKFDISRPKFRHLGFGEGLHRCLGAPLARLEAQIFLEEALDIMGKFQLDGEAIFYPSSPNMYVWWNLPIQIGN